MDTVERGAIIAAEEEKGVHRQHAREASLKRPEHAYSGVLPSRPHSDSSLSARQLPDPEKGAPSTTLPADGLPSPSPSSSSSPPPFYPCSEPPCPPSSSSLPPLRALSFLDRYLVVWIVLAMALGIILSNTVPSTATALQQSTFVGVSVPIAVGLLVMMYPILCKVRFETLHLLLRQRRLWVHLGLSFALNWIAAPLLMTGLAWAFLPDRPELRQGLIFVGVARCIAMVLVWTDLAGGDGDYCAVLVAFNSVLQMLLFAPLAVFYVKVVSGGAGGDDGLQNLSYALVARSVGVFLGIPLAAAVLTRLALFPLLGERRYQALMRWMGPWSLVGLLYTIVVLFGSQGAHVVRQITSVLRVCAPLVVYFAITFGVTVALCYRVFGFGYRLSCTQSFTAASNNFELAIAVVVATFGAGSEQALASTVGPLIEVPVLVALVYVLKWCKSRWGWKD